MKTWLSIVLTFGLAVAARAQVSVAVVLDQGHYLANEELIVKVKITNYSGQSMAFGEDDDWLSFSVESVDNYVVSQLAPVPVSGKFSLESSTVGTRRVDISPYFNIARPGRYKISASVKVPAWGKSFVSRPEIFDITSGSKLGEMTFGVPSADAGNSPEVRKYVLQQSTQPRHMKLYVRVCSADEGVTYKVFPIGQMVSFTKPEQQLDKESRLHVLHQTGARSFAYHVITPNGDVAIRQSYDYAASRPTLRVDREGGLSVTGGARRVTNGDLPRPESAGSSDDTKGTNP